MMIEFLMKPVRLLASSLTPVCVVLAGASLAASPGESPWVGESYSKVRLVSGSVAGMSDNQLIAGIQIRLEPGWKTYWRMPGDSGVPPSFDWSGSKNLRSAEVLYPAPHRFTDASGTAIGYEDEVVFPVMVTPERRDEPVELKLNVDFGICKTLCIPNQANLSIELPPRAAGKVDDPLLTRFVDLVPKPAETGKLPALGGIEAKLDSAKPELIVDANFTDGATGTDLFIEGPEGEFVPVPKPLGPAQNGKQRFVVSFASPAEAEAIRGKPMTLTFVSDEGAREASVTVE
ncbi:MAG TPA: protein-disulfide reductase DsbD domain-containing protein [Methyloceanibacter sp.]|nr:protein-disulfide reductase DsbD domain-containing protein [Methyloceanibacter sp.]